MVSRRLSSVLDRGETGASCYIGHVIKLKFKTIPFLTPVPIVMEVMLHRHLSQLNRKAVSRFRVCNSVSLSHICRNYNVPQFVASLNKCRYIYP